MREIITLEDFNLEGVYRINNFVLHAKLLYISHTISHTSGHGKILHYTKTNNNIFLKICSCLFSGFPLQNDNKLRVAVMNSDNKEKILNMLTEYESDFTRI